ncbi:MAG: hypothetical protein IBX45_00450 [Campylobacterales bacterium]|nr:hypothetical protein [Campylobacterales bacterium]
MNADTKVMHYLLEILAKCEESETKALHQAVLEALDKEALCSKTRFTCKQIKALLKADGAVELTGTNQALSLLARYRNQALPEELKLKRQHLIHTLLGANFPQKQHFLSTSLQAFESELSPVEAKMYGLIRLYLSSISEAIELFVLFDTRKEASFEAASGYVLGLHKHLNETLFYKEERLLVEEGLGKMSVILLGVYYQHLYM